MRISRSTSFFNDSGISVSNRRIAPSMSSDSSADWIFSTNTMFGAAGFTSGVFFGAACSGTEAQAEKQQNRIPAAKTDIFVFIIGILQIKPIFRRLK